MVLYTSVFLGVIGSLFSMLQFLASPVMGAASDVYGRKPILVVSMVTSFNKQYNDPAVVTLHKAGWVC